MAEDVRDLLVRLSFEHGDTRSQISAIKNELKALDSSMAATAAAASGFSDSLNRSAVQAGGLREKLNLQQMAVRKYGDALEAAKGRLKSASDRHAEYGRRLDEARTKQGNLTAQMSQLKQAMAASKAATGKNTEEYAAMADQLDDLKAALAANKEEISALEQGYARSDRSIATAARSVQNLKNAQQEAVAAERQMSAQLEQLNGRVQRHADQLEHASKQMHNYALSAKAAGEAQQAAGRVMSKGSAVVVTAGAAAVGSAIKWESDFAGVRKTVNGTAEELEGLSEALLDMGEVKSANYTELATIAANAGQLGIATENVESFTGTMADLAETTDLTADAASSSFAQFANITNMSQTNFGNMGSAVVELGNNLATTESKTVDMAMRIAAAGTQAGLTQAQILGLAGGLSSLGLEAEAGGTAFSKALIGMQVAVETGSEDLANYAAVANMTAEEFSAAFKADAAGTFIKFVQGLSTGSKSAIVMLDEMGVTEVRLRDTLLRASNASELLTESVNMSTEAWAENVALTDEANVRYDTTASRMQMLGNKAQRAAIDFGNALLPALESGMETVDGIIESFSALDEEQRQQIVTWGAYAAAAGPAMMLLGKANTMLSGAAEGMSKFLSAAASGHAGLSGVVGGIGKLLGPAGVVALTVALGYGAYKFYDWASGAQAAREAMQDMVDVAKEMRETQAQTVYDTGNADPLSRFGLTKEAFSGTITEAEDWMASLTKVWSDGQRETDDQVRAYAESFAQTSDGVREKIQSRGSLLEGLGTLDDDAKGKMDADLAQLDSWDKEIADLLAKRQNGMLTEGDQTRLNEVIKLRAELELEYSGGEGSGYEQIIGGMQAEVDRLKAQGAEADASLYGDTLTALADGRSAYMDALNATYDAQHAQIMAIEDETTRTAALAALNDQFNARRLEGENAYNAAVKEAATATWENTGMETQVDQINQLAALLSDTSNLDLSAIANWTEGMDEGKMTSMITLVEQLKASGATDSELAQLGIDADDLLSKIQQIKDIAGSTEGLTGLSEIFGETLPEEIQRIMIGLDMTQAAQDWSDFSEGLTDFEIPGTVRVELSPLDQATIDTWSAANGGEDGLVAKVGVGLGTGWETKLQTALDAGMLSVYGADGMPIPVTPKVLEQITGDDLMVLDEDGTYHVIITPELGTPESVQQSNENMNMPSGGPGNLLSLGSVGSFSSQDVVDNINEAAAAVDLWKQKIAEMKEAGEGTDSAENIQQGAVGNLTSSLEALTQVDIDNISTQIATLMASIGSGTLDETGLAEAQAQLESLLTVVSAADQYLGTGNNVSAGIAQGMNAYGWSGDATTLAGSIQAAINSALGVASPARTMVPTGSFVAAGIAQGMMTYSYAPAAALASLQIRAAFVTLPLQGLMIGSNFGQGLHRGLTSQSSRAVAAAASASSQIRGAFASLPSQGAAIGSNFGQGLYRGLSSQMSRTLALARSYAAKITATFRSAWKIHSPSRVAEGLTEMFGRGLEKGMERWPTVSEHVLTNDIMSAQRGMNQVVNSTDRRSFAATSNVTIQSLQVRDEQDVQQISEELARLIQSDQRATGNVR